MAIFISLHFVWNCNFLYTFKASYSAETYILNELWLLSSTSLLLPLRTTPPVTPKMTPRSEYIPKGRSWASGSSQLKSIPACFIISPSSSVVSNQISIRLTVGHEFFPALLFFGGAGHYGHTKACAGRSYALY